ncbi:MAG: AAA domain-containing protein, partial [Thermoplasmata archaeon]
MLNLHFANMPGVPESDLQILLERTYNNYWPFWMYLSKAKERIEAQVLKLAWEGPFDPDEISERAENGSKRSRRKVDRSKKREKDAIGFWIRLKEIDPDTPEETFKEFFDADLISDKAKVERGDIEILDSEPEIGAICVSRLPTGEKVYIHPNTWNLFRELMAIENIRQNPHDAHRPLITLAEGRNMTRWNPVSSVGSIRWKILDDDTFAGVEEQREFVKKALGTPDFAILEGPPGCGKTITICELILQEIELGHRVLLCASTHVAVDNVLEKLGDMGWMEKSVVAVRIAAREKGVSELVRHLLLKNRLETERSELVRKLMRIRRRTPAQDYLLKALQEDSEQILRRLILDSANLVCGTTIGILKHPDIAAGLSRPAFPQFDTLIVDEASKTPFQEFLVPALYAKKWILVGDVNQLSPFVNTIEVEANLAGILYEQESRAILPAFKAFVRTRRKSGKKRSFLCCDPDPKVREWALKQAETLGVPTAQLSPQTAERGDLSPLWADFMIADAKDLSSIDHLLPLNVQILSETSPTTRLTRRMAYWKQHHREEAQYEERMEREENTWASEIGWRLVRQFELRRRPDEAERYARDVDALLPKWLDEDVMG